MAVGATAVAGLVLTARTLSLLVEKRLVTEAEATEIILATGNEISEDEVGQREAVKAALMSVFPSIKF